MTPWHPLYTVSVCRKDCRAIALRSCAVQKDERYRNTKVDDCFHGLDFRYTCGFLSLP